VNGFIQVYSFFLTCPPNKTEIAVLPAILPWISCLWEKLYLPGRGKLYRKRYAPGSSEGF
jgi:hypothetical protein